eukprot:12413255-Karenia_brevis.AAC.1
MPEQRGFIRGRAMLRNAIDVEHASVILAQKCPGAVAAFFDYSAAFPSLARLFIWMTLCWLKIPLEIVRAILALYQNNLHLISYCGLVKRAFTVFAGVRQGCPLSSTIFVIATDAINRYLASSLNPASLLRIYADDTAIVFAKFAQEVPAIAMVFQQIALITCLSLNHSKSILIPLNMIGGVLREFLQQHLPEWCDFSIALVAKYLGFYIGPGMGFMQWDKTFDQIIRLCSVINASGAPIFQRILLYNTYCISKLFFPAQLRPLPPHFKRCEEKALNLILKGPAKLCKRKFLYNLRELGLFPISIPSFEVCCRASATRALVCTPDWSQQYMEIQSVLLNGCALALHPHPKWVDSYCLAFFSKTAQLNERKLRGFNHYDEDQDRHPVIQREANRAILSSLYPCSLREFFHHSLSRWLDGQKLATSANKLIIMCNFLKGRIPPCIWHALFTLWSNAWPTSRRFQ